MEPVQLATNVHLGRLLCLSQIDDRIIILILEDISRSGALTRLSSLLSEEEQTKYSFPKWRIRMIKYVQIQSIQDLFSHLQFLAPARSGRQKWSSSSL